MSDLIRTFIAVPLPDEVKAALGQLQRVLRAANADVKWVKPELMHITLKFLGSVSPETPGTIAGGLNDSLASCRQFRLCTGKPGAFPSAKKPRVLWVGLLPDGLTPLRNLQSRVEHTVKESGFPPEKKQFNPHLTLGRVRSLKKIEPLLDKFSSLRLSSVEFSVREVLVMRSDLTPQGPIYTVQHSIPLQD